MKNIRKQERRYFVYDIVETGTYGKFRKEHVGEVFARNEKEALHKAKTEFSSSATVETKYPTIEEMEYYESDNTGKYILHGTSETGRF